MAERCHWIMRLSCRCVLAVCVADGRTAADAARFLLGSPPYEPGMSMDLITDAEWQRDIAPTFGEHTCGGAS